LAVRLVRALPEAIELCGRIIARLDDAADLATRVRARVDAGRILGALHQFDAAREKVAEGERIAKGNEALVKTALAASDEQAGRQGDFKRSLELLERIQKIVTVEGDKNEEHKIMLNLAQAHAAIGDKRSALTYLDRAGQLVSQDSTAACERQKAW